jgi:hypothetical protein
MTGGDNSGNINLLERCTARFPTSVYRDSQPDRLWKNMYQPSGSVEGQGSFGWSPSTMKGGSRRAVDRCLPPDRFRFPLLFPGAEPSVHEAESQADSHRGPVRWTRQNWSPSGCPAKPAVRIRPSARQGNRTICVTDLPHAQTTDGKRTNRATSAIRCGPVVNLRRSGHYHSRKPGHQQG